MGTIHACHFAGDEGGATPYWACNFAITRASWAACACRAASDTRAASQSLRSAASASCLACAAASRADSSPATDGTATCTTGAATTDCTTTAGTTGAVATVATYCRVQTPLVQTV